MDLNLQDLFHKIPPQPGKQIAEPPPPYKQAEGPSYKLEGSEAFEEGAEAVEEDEVSSLLKDAKLLGYEKIDALLSNPDFSDAKRRNIIEKKF